MDRIRSEFYRFDSIYDLCVIVFPSLAQTAPIQVARLKELGEGYFISLLVFKISLALNV